MRDASISDPAEAALAGLTIAGLARLSVCDWPGRLVATVFLQGCPWRCAYCHNPDLIDPRAPGVVSGSEVAAFLRSRVGLLDGVVFSGGEPTGQAGLFAAIEQVGQVGFQVGLHTGGGYPRRLAQVLPGLDWVGLDIKGLAGEYPAITGVGSASARAWQALGLVLDSGVAYEVRTTVDPRLHTAVGLTELIAELLGAGVCNLVLQEARTPDGVVAAGVSALLDQLGPLPDGVWRRKS